MSVVSSWIPVLTSEAGLSLTAANWQEIQVNTASYYLDALLLKPGLAVLQAIPNLASYVNWSGPIILNASRFKGNREGIITLVSPYDGSKIKLTYPQVIDLINHLKPTVAILPPEILKEYPQVWDNWNKEITPFLSGNHIAEDKLPLACGVYFNFDHSSLNIKEHLDKYQHVARYVQGPLSYELINELSQMGIPYIESSEPAQLGLDGIVYSLEGTIDLKEEHHTVQFTKIDPQCDCCICSAQFTKAYLHHLFLHTPLLCQRFLIQHNGHYVQNSLRIAQSTSFRA